MNRCSAGLIEMQSEPVHVITEPRAAAATTQLSLTGGL